MNDLFLSDSSSSKRYKDVERHVYIGDMQDGEVGKARTFQCRSAIGYRVQRKVILWSRTSVLNGLAMKLKDMMADFQGLRTKIACEYKKMVHRSGEGETLLLKEIEEQGQEIQDRLDAVNEMERRTFIELHQVFFDMATLLDAAKDYQKSSRKWTCIAMVICTCVIAILLLPIFLHSV
ncbi:hypothetical protein ACFX13_046281 [Malus domestica]